MHRVHRAPAPDRRCRRGDRQSPPGRRRGGVQLPGQRAACDGTWFATRQRRRVAAEIVDVGPGCERPAGFPVPRSGAMDGSVVWTMAFLCRLGLEPSGWRSLSSTGPFVALRVARTACVRATMYPPPPPPAYRLAVDRCSRSSKNLRASPAFRGTKDAIPTLCRGPSARAHIFVL